MTSTGFCTASFPSMKRSVRAQWAPVLLEPISGSYERLVIGVAVVSDGGFHVEIANALERLRCLYSDGAQGAIYAIQLTAEHLKEDLRRRAAEALTDAKPTVSGVVIGECRDAEGESLQAIGATWMRALSSLYQDANEVAENFPAEVVDQAAAQSDGDGDRLPFLVFDYVTERREGFVKFFSRDLRSGRSRRLTGRSHEVFIDFSGSRVVANFGTLQVGSLARSVNLVKRRLWDLKVDRDRARDSVLVRNHELILQSPSAGDPQVTARQYASIQKTLESLEEQADQEELRLRAMNTVPEIGEHLLRLEAVA